MRRIILPAKKNGANITAYTVATSAKKGNANAHTVTNVTYTDTTVSINADVVVNDH